MQDTQTQAKNSNKQLLDGLLQVVEISDRERETHGSLTTWNLNRGI